MTPEVSDAVKQWGVSTIAPKGCHSTEQANVSTPLWSALVRVSGAVNYQAHRGPRISTEAAFLTPALRHLVASRAVAAAVLLPDVGRQDVVKRSHGTAPDGGYAFKKTQRCVLFGLIAQHAGQLRPLVLGRDRPCVVERTRLADGDLLGTVVGDKPEFLSVACVRRIAEQAIDRLGRGAR